MLLHYLLLPIRTLWLLPHSEQAEKGGVDKVVQDRVQLRHVGRLNCIYIAGLGEIAQVPSINTALGGVA
jgi:hypothetical protein